jgi:hypothetical protein
MCFRDRRELLAEMRKPVRTRRTSAADQCKSFTDASGNLPLAWNSLSGLPDLRLWKREARQDLVG